MQVFRTLRNHWKKSVFAFAAVSYGSYWSYQRYQSNEIRRFYCRQAALLGAQTLPSMTPVRRVAVLLNGKAYRNKAKSIFDKTIFPLLHLFGVDVRVYRVDNRADDQALRDLLNKDIESEELNALIVVGGDGTLTRLMPIFLQSATLKSLPICLVPIGENATFARKLFPSTEKKHLHDDLVLLCESVFALFNGTVVQRPTLKITLANEPEKPIYATSLEFGHYSRLEQLQRRLWYFSYLKYPISSAYHLLTNRLESVVSPSSTLSYVNQCSGCSRCQPRSLDVDDERIEAERQKPNKSFFSKLYRSTRETTATPVVPPSSSSSTPNVINPDCGVEHPLERSASLFQMWINVLDNRQAFQLTFANDFHRWNFDAEKPAKETRLVQRLRFDPNASFVGKSFLVDHEKNEQIVDSSECRVEISEETLKYLQVNPTPLIQRPLTFQPTRVELEEKELGEKGLFLFAQRV